MPQGKQSNLSEIAEREYLAARKSNDGNLRLKAIAEELLDKPDPPAVSPEPLTGQTQRNREVSNKIKTNKTIIATIVIIFGLGGSVGISYIVLQYIQSNTSTQPSPNRNYFHSAGSTGTDEWCRQIYQNLLARRTGEVPENVDFVGVDKNNAQCFYETKSSTK